MGYLKDTIRGISWIGGLRGITRLVTLLKLAILARLLTPAQFGLFGIAALVLAFLEIISETGINVFLIQHKGKYEEYVDTAWVVSIIRGAAISLFIFLLSPFIAVFFKNSAVTPLLYLTALIPLVRGFINPINIRYQKNLEFAKEFSYRFAVTFIEFSASIYFAFVLRSPESLLYAMIVSGIFEVFLSFIFIKPNPKLKFEIKKASEIIKKGKWVTGFGLFNYLFSQGDDIVVGRILGEAPLGIYQNAYKLASLPLSELNDVFFKVTFPIYTKMANDLKRLREAVIKQVIFTTLIMLTFGLILFIFSREIVLLVLGPQWINAIPVVKVLAFLGAIRGISFSFNSLFLALEKQKYITYITFVSLAGLTITIIPLINKFGLVGAGASEMVGSLFALPVALYFINKTFKKL